MSGLGLKGFDLEVREHKMCDHSDNTKIRGFCPTGLVINDLPLDGGGRSRYNYYQ